MGSRNPTKVEASRRVFERLGLKRLTALSVLSGVPEQPIGWEETKRGAEERARGARREADARFGVGLEGGVDLYPDGSVWLIGAAVVEDTQGRILWAAGPRMRLPPSLYRPLVAGRELGPLMEAQSGPESAKTGPGAIGYLTGGLVPREALWVITLSCAVGPLFWPDLYGSSDRSQVLPAAPSRQPG